MSTRYENAGDDSMAGQQHRVMMMIAHAINNSQNGITIGGFHLQLNNENDNNTDGQINADGDDMQEDDNADTGGIAGTTAQLFSGLMSNPQNGINSSCQQDENGENDYNDWTADDADGEGDDNYYDMYETGHGGVDGVTFESGHGEGENRFEENEEDEEDNLNGDDDGDDDNVSLS